MTCPSGLSSSFHSAGEKLEAAKCEGVDCSEPENSAPISAFNYLDSSDLRNRSQVQRKMNKREIEDLVCACLHVLAHMCVYVSLHVFWSTRFSRLHRPDPQKKEAK